MEVFPDEGGWGTYPLTTFATDIFAFHQFSLNLVQNVTVLLFLENGDLWPWKSMKGSNDTISFQHEMKQFEIVIPILLLNIIETFLVQLLEPPLDPNFHMFIPSTNSDAFFNSSNEIAVLVVDAVMGDVGGGEGGVVFEQVVLMLLLVGSVGHW